MNNYIELTNEEYNAIMEFRGEAELAHNLKRRAELASGNHDKSKYNKLKTYEDKIRNKGIGKQASNINTANTRKGYAKMKNFDLMNKFDND